MRPRNLIVQGAGHGISSLTSMIHLRHLDCPSVHVNLRSLRRYRLCPSFRVVHAGRKSCSILFTSRDGLEVWSGQFCIGPGPRPGARPSDPVTTTGQTSSRRRFRSGAPESGRNVALNCMASCSLGQPRRGMQREGPPRRVGVKDVLLPGGTWARMVFLVDERVV